MSAPIRWVSAVLGTPAAASEITEAFWAGVTGYGLRRDAADNAETRLAPGTGDPYLRLVRLGRHSGTHHPPRDRREERRHHRCPCRDASEPTCTCSRTDIARRLARAGSARSIVEGDRGIRPKPSRQPGGRTTVDQVSLDVPPSCLAAEIAFWSGLTEWKHLDRTPRTSSRGLVRPDGIPLAMLFQRLDDEQVVVTAHLDLACDDRAAETRPARAARGAPSSPGTPAGPSCRTRRAGSYCITAATPAGLTPAADTSGRRREGDRADGWGSAQLGHEGREPGSARDPELAVDVREVGVNGAR